MRELWFQKDEACYFAGMDNEGDPIHAVASLFLRTDCDADLIIIQIDDGIHPPSEYELPVDGHVIVAPENWDVFMPRQVRDMLKRNGFDVSSISN